MDSGQAAAAMMRACVERDGESGKTEWLVEADIKDSLTT